MQLVSVLEDDIPLSSALLEKAIKMRAKRKHIMTVILCNGLLKFQCIYDGKPVRKIKDNNHINLLYSINFIGSSNSSISCD